MSIAGSAFGAARTTLADSALSPSSLHHSGLATSAHALLLRQHVKSRCRGLCPGLRSHRKLTGNRSLASRNRCAASTTCAPSFGEHHTEVVVGPGLVAGSRAISGRAVSGRACSSVGSPTGREGRACGRVAPSWKVRCGVERELGHTHTPHTHTHTPTRAPGGDDGLEHLFALCQTGTRRGRKWHGHHFSIAGLCRRATSYHELQYSDSTVCIRHLP